MKKPALPDKRARGIEFWKGESLHPAVHVGRSGAAGYLGPETRRAGRSSGLFSPIATRIPDIRVCEHFPLLAARTDKLAIIRSMTHNNVDHTVATHFLLTGMPPLPGGSKYTDWPHLGSVLSRLGRGTDPLPRLFRCDPNCPAMSRGSSKRAAGNSQAGSARRSIPDDRRQSRRGRLPRRRFRSSGRDFIAAST